MGGRPQGSPLRIGCKGCGEESPSHGFAVPAPVRQGGQGDGGCGCSCCGAQNFHAALRRTLEILTAATRSLRFLCHRQRSVRSPHRPAAPAPLTKTPVIARALRRPWQSASPVSFSTQKKEDASRHPLFYTFDSLENYFSSILAPTSSSSFFMFSASSLDRASFRVVGVSSTAFLASARPRPVISRTDLMTLIF